MTDLLNGRASYDPEADAIGVGLLHVRTLLAQGATASAASFQPSGRRPQ